ncbi:hypothetical protein E1212_29085 [Jiangella ureilytica]|uniref:Uncharacterized protein n=1 Tax=Jiangella ureilytica TaxID=2530374 RepID=A0A4R4R9C9_9ACTN|nr:hypothetical protein [Jiangella ureilytica]TDC45249.1 hypothetical protein E1212_29085 [Jiangella ureilytica]
MAYEFNSLLGRLVGYRLYSVQFVADYVQLWFDNDPTRDVPVLTCDVLPTVILGDRQVVPNQTGWTDALVALIGQDVAATHEAIGAGVRLDLSIGSIQLRPTEKELVGPEIATLSHFDDRAWMTWRPGEEAFEYL